MFFRRKRFWEDVCGHVARGLDGWVSPRTGTSEWIVLDRCVDTRHGCAWCGNVSSCSFCWVWLLVGGAGFSDDSSHILVGSSHGRCFRTMTRGIEMCVLDGVNTRSLTGSGCESFHGTTSTRRSWSFDRDTLEPRGGSGGDQGVGVEETEETLSKDHYQAFFWVLIDLIVELLGLIIKPFDNQTESWNPVSNDLIIKSFDTIIW